MSNATAAGPSYGLLDVLFGSKPQEAESGDGQGFDALMNLVKSLNKNGKEEKDLSRTDKGTEPGMGLGDSQAAMIVPGQAEMMGQSEIENQERQMRERMAALYGIGANPMAPQNLPKLDASQVDQALKAKSLPPLSESERKLLDAVNGKMDKVNRELSVSAEILNSMKAADSQELPASAKETVPESAFLKELAQKGIDSRNLKAAEAQGTPETFVNTESYLKLHESMGKGAVKDAAAAKRELAEVNDGAPAKAPLSANNLVRSAVNEAGGKEKELFGRTPRDLTKGELGRKAQGPAVSGFTSELLQSLDKGGQGGEVKNVILTGKPEEMRPALLGEVQNGVHLQAVKGGGEMRLIINPEEMGEVKLKVGTKNGKVEVEVTAENSKVAQMIKGGAHELESSLKDQNLSLTRFEVTVTDSSPVVSTDTRSNLSDQFLSQNPQPGFSNGRDDGGSAFSRWDGSQQQRQGSGVGTMAAEDELRKASARLVSNPRSSARDSARRLDVVA